VATSASQQNVPKSAWRESTWLAAAEFCIVAALYIGDVYRLIPISKTLFLFALGWISLRLRGSGWASVGLAQPRNWRRAIAVGLVAGGGLVLLELFVSYPLLTRLTGKPPDLSDFRPIVGNFGLFLSTVTLIWILAVLGEELVYRGYLMNRVAGLGGGTRNAWIVSLVLVSIMFGAGHIDQGATGMTENVINGLLLGLLYLGSGRNLVVPIVAHGVGNTVDLLLIYLGRFPGL
jgi:membrane protease YdiL (CAAX protease family)